MGLGERSRLKWRFLKSWEIPKSPRVSKVPRWFHGLDDLGVPPILGNLHVGHVLKFLVQCSFPTQLWMEDEVFQLLVHKLRDVFPIRSSQSCCLRNGQLGPFRPIENG